MYVCMFFQRVDYKKIESIFANMKPIDRSTQKFIEKLTLGQSKNSLWLGLRMARITASKVGRIMKMTKKSCPEKLLQEIFGYKPIFQSQAMKSGLENEEMVTQLYLKFMNEPNISVHDCGMFLSTEQTFLGSTPDKIVKTPESEWLLEIKCFFPSYTTSKTVAELLKEKKYSPLIFQNGKWKICRNHDFYFQVLTQMYCTGMTRCDLALFFNGDLLVFPVLFDAYFFKQKCIPKLTYFYKRYVLPELIYRRVRSGYKLYSDEKL